MQPSTCFYHSHDATTSPSTQSFTDTKHKLPKYPLPGRSTIMSVVNNMEPKHSNVHNLMSPPDGPAYDNFEQPTMSKGALPRSAPLSPPISPDVASDKQPTVNPSSNAIADPILYPSIEPQSATSSQAPLFTDDDFAQKHLVEEHMKARDSSIFRAASPPRHEEYQLVLEFKSTVMTQFLANRAKWMARERGFLLADREIHRGGARGQRYQYIAPATGNGKHTGGVKHSRVTKPTVIRTPGPSRQPVVRDSPGPKANGGTREDRDFNSIRNICPPLDSLPHKHNSMKVEWKGAPIDLSGDPHAHLLHSDELALASNLRLDCATYLCSKRRIFLHRLECLRKGKEFRKTDAQQACKIDVNKASKLHTAFEKVGWLHRKWVEEYL